MTGMILAMARGAGEVAPLMLVGAVKLAPELVIDTNSSAPFVHVHPERSFMHLGFHIYDLGFQSQNSEAAKPMVFTTTLLLIALIAEGLGPRAAFGSSGTSPPSAKDAPPLTLPTVSIPFIAQRRFGDADDRPHPTTPP
jgi:hypothetical protein